MVRWSAVETGGSGSRGRAKWRKAARGSASERLRLGHEAQGRDVGRASGCGRIKKRMAARGSASELLCWIGSRWAAVGSGDAADLEALGRGLARFRATASVQCAFVDAPFAFSVTDRLTYPGSRAAVLGSADGCPHASGELGASR